MRFRLNPSKSVVNVPDIICNPNTDQKFKKGKFLGKGGFARCYELTDMNTSEVFAGKVIPKSLLTKKHQRDKVVQEVRIHKTLDHPNIVHLNGFFEDRENVYIILELCSRRSLVELHKRRGFVTEPEARYLIKQIVHACEYLHINRVIHRDLKLGNVFLNDDMVAKIGDFGLATVLDYDGERKRTLCGTPNYIAPEVLEKTGHSYEVDIWAIGCILYTLLVGNPPFETSTLEQTYEKIQKNDYTIPSVVGDRAAKLIRALLQNDPTRRPSITQIENYQFFDGYTPTKLPTTCLVTAPKFGNTDFATERQICGEVDVNTENVPTRAPQPAIRREYKSEKRVVKKTGDPKVPTRAEGGDQVGNSYLSELLRQVNEVIVAGEAPQREICEDLLEDPASTPVYWISKWVDYSDKYGLGYELCDNSIGVVFNDGTKVVLDANGGQLQYIGRDEKEEFYSITKYPSVLRKKITLLAYFRNYMSAHLQTAGGDPPIRDGDELAHLPVLRTWFRTRTAIVLHLNNGTAQINFFDDHTKIIICPLMGAATYIDQDRNTHVLKLAALIKHGCPPEVYRRLKFAKLMVERLMSYEKDNLHNNGNVPHDMSWD